MFALSACTDVIYKETGKEISLRKTVNLTTVSEPGQVLTYTYEVKNNTVFPSGYQFSAMKIVVTDSPLDGLVTCGAISLASEASTICTAKYTVTEKDIANGSVTNDALVTASYTTEDCIYASNIASSCDFFVVNHTATAKDSVTVNVDLSIPTATTEPTMTPTQPSPVLTGEVTYCDPATDTMNLRIDHTFVPSSFNHQVTINGDPMACKVNGSNSSLLTCSYPPSVVFPANIKVSINDIVVNDFMYDGSACVIPATPTKEPNKPECDPATGYCP